MTIRPIHSKADHHTALARIDTLRGASPGTPEHDQINLASAHGEERRPVRPPDPIDAIDSPAEGSAEVPFGALRGGIRMAPDFDQTPDEIIDAMTSDTV